VELNKLNARILNMEKGGKEKISGRAKVSQQKKKKK